MMRDNKLYTPVGVRDILWEECALKRRLSGAVTDAFVRYGYRQVESPAFEYIEVFSDEKRGATRPGQMYKFFDREGATLALRSDMTPPIARMAATSFGGRIHPLRFSYYGNVYCYNENYQGKRGEISQAGVELLGANSVDADGEVIAVAVEGLLAAGLTEFKITIGDVGFFKGILEETGLPEEICDKLQQNIGARNFVEVETILSKESIPEDVKHLFAALPHLVGGTEILKQAGDMTKSTRAKAAAARLEALYEVLKSHGVAPYIVFDLGMVHQLNYYTGIIFRGYTSECGYAVVTGGRYDNLVEQYGAPMPAVGFCLKISELVNIFMRKGQGSGKDVPKALIAYTPEGRRTAFSVAVRYRKAGVAVENSLFGMDNEAAFSYAKETGIGHVLYFLNENVVRVSSLLDEMGGYTVEIPVAELVIPGEEEA